MTIKKPTKTTAEAPLAPVAAPGGATIADRFKLDLTDPSLKKAPAGKGALFAVIAGVLALGVSGILTYIIWQHWQFLANA